MCFSDALMSQYSNSVSGYALACCFMLLKLALEYFLWVLLWTTILSDPHNQEGQIDVDHFNVLLPQLNGDMIH